MLKYFNLRKIKKKFFIDLCKRYGKSEFYSVGQIRNTIKECGYSNKYFAYPMAMFLDDVSFNTLMKSMGLSEKFVYSDLRSEIAEYYDISYFEKTNFFTEQENSGEALHDPDNNSHQKYFDFDQ